MTYMDRTFGLRVVAQEVGGGSGKVTREPLVLVVEDEYSISGGIISVCECLNIGVERISTYDDLASVLRQRRPMAVVAEMDAAGQDGCNVLMTVSGHDRDLPVLVITGDDPTLLGAIDAVEEIWQLTAVDKWPRLLGIGAVVDFLFRAGRKGSCLRLMSL